MDEAHILDALMSWRILLLMLNCEMTAAPLQCIVMYYFPSWSCIRQHHQLSTSQLCEQIYGIASFLRADRNATMTD